MREKKIILQNPQVIPIRTPNIIPFGGLDDDLPLGMREKKIILQNPKVMPIRGLNNFAETAKVSPRQTEQ
jgi:hypothetical protein